MSYVLVRFSCFKTMSGCEILGMSDLDVSILATC